MRGVESVSEELAQMVERLPPKQFIKVVDAALAIVADDYPDDPDVQHAIGSYRTDPVAAQALSKDLLQTAEECDRTYILLEEEGRMAESDANYRKMWVLHALASLVAAPTATREILDEVVYDLGAGAADLELFAKKMIERLRSAETAR